MNVNSITLDASAECILLLLYLHFLSVFLLHRYPGLLWNRTNLSRSRSVVLSRMPTITPSASDEQYFFIPLDIFTNLVQFYLKIIEEYSITIKNI